MAWINLYLAPQPYKHFSTFVHLATAKPTHSMILPLLVQGSLSVGSIASNDPGP
jgi:hypothetical protein